MFCQYLPPEDYNPVECVPYVIPAIDEVCWSVTNYWPFDSEGRLVAFMGQTDSDPTNTANGTIITGVEQDGDWVAAPLSLVGTMIQFPDSVPIPVNDTFGNKEYQNGVFWHSYYGQYVIGIDVFTATPLHYLECHGLLDYYSLSSSKHREYRH